MKMSKERYGQLLEAIAKVVDAYGGTEAFKENVSHLSPQTVGWKLLKAVMNNWAYDDSHPFYQNGAWRRILPCNGVNYSTLYSEGLNDSHIETALLRILKEIGLK